jgi:signal peptidase
MEAGARTDSPRPRPLRFVARFAGHVALLAVWTLVGIMAIATWAPHMSRFKTDIIVGQSMEPTIPLYSVIVVEPVDPASIRVGDVITFQQPDEPDRRVTHRVQKIEHGKGGVLQFVTKGDNNEVRDPWRVTYEQQGYRVRTHVPHVGWIMIQAQTRLARLALVVVPVLLLLGQFLKWVWRDEDEDEDELAAPLEDDAWLYGEEQSVA